MFKQLISIGQILPMLIPKKLPISINQHIPSMKFKSTTCQRHLYKRKISSMLFLILLLKLKEKYCLILGLDEIEVHFYYNITEYKFYSG